MTIWQKIIIGAITGHLWLLSIVAKHFWPDIGQDVAFFVYTCAAVLGTLGIHGIATGVTSVRAPVAPPGQTGFASVRMLAVVIGIALGLSMLAGCTTTTASLYRGYMTDAVAGVKTWDDNTVATLQTLVCAQPYSAIQRHPEIQPAVQAMCGPLANTASLDANQLALLMGVLQQSGVRLQAAPAASGAK